MLWKTLLKINLKKKNKMTKEKEKIFYEIKIFCKNCQRETEVHIPVGTTMKAYCKKEKCNMCKCPLK